MNKFFMCIFSIYASVSICCAAELRLIAENAPPNSFTVNGQPTGKSVEIVQAILDTIDMPSNDIEVMPWARGYWNLENIPNVALFPTSRTSERESKFKWVGPIFENEVNLYKLKSRQDIWVNSLTDLNNYSVGSGRNDQKTRFLLSKGIEVNQVSVEHQNIQKLFIGRIDIIAYQSGRLFYDVKQLNYNFEKIEKITNIPEMSKDAFMAFHIDTSDEVVRRFQEGLNAIRESGEHAEILRKWEGTLGNP
ncbi:transporter substrate-binding domain-containing protein [Vibrio penaeicida]|uniref:substrate-binding periplasmic protein n=1 Tax=Vibrio penaeicida TaxID=104609 RepID=UPI00273364F7|nr:transporter substrate-binding domain-containing protein [Vibrio penaeicida]MDP2575446.1 transporter substrate-binding domain-containing protein [Vibrio penaeicida]